MAIIVYILCIPWGFAIGALLVQIVLGEMYNVSLSGLSGAHRNWFLFGNKNVDPYHLTGLRARVYSLFFLFLIIVVGISLPFTPGIPLSDIIAEANPNKIIVTLITLIVAVFGFRFNKSRIEKLKARYLGNGQVSLQ